MEKFLCKGGTLRSRWAISLCFASTTLLSLEALHPGGCVWLGLNASQSFALSASLATVCMFLATFILTKIMCDQSPDK